MTQTENQGTNYSIGPNWARIKISICISFLFLAPPKRHPATRETGSPPRKSMPKPQRIQSIHTYPNNLQKRKNTCVLPILKSFPSDSSRFTDTWHQKTKKHVTTFRVTSGKEDSVEGGRPNLFVLLFVRRGESGSPPARGCFTLFCFTGTPAKHRGERVTKSESRRFSTSGSRSDGPGSVSRLFSVPSYEGVGATKVGACIDEVTY